MSRNSKRGDLRAWRPATRAAAGGVRRRSERRAITDASEGHIQLVRRLFFGGLPADHLAAVTESLEAVYENLIENGSLPAPEENDASGPAERDSPTRGPRRPA